MDENKPGPVSFLLIALGASLAIAGRVAASPCDFTQVPYCTWPGSTSPFIDWNESGSIIDFEVLPDGSPSHYGVWITPMFNYALSGATFSSIYPTMWVVGFPETGYRLEAWHNGAVVPVSIQAQLTQPARGVGVWVTGHTRITATTVNSTYVSISHDDPGAMYFLGIKSLTPIRSLTIDQYGSRVSFDNFTMVYDAIPEPSGLAVLLLGGLLTFDRRRSAQNAN